MSRFIKNLSLFIAGAIPLLGKSGAAGLPPDEAAWELLNEPKAVPLRPLNADYDNLFAGHRSHSSHSSHSSHYSSSSGSSSYTPPRAPASSYTAPANAPASAVPIYTPSSAASGNAGTGGGQSSRGIVPAAASTDSVALTRNEKLELQIMRVQIKLTSLGLYGGTIDGILGKSTVEALKLFQDLKRLPATGQMSTQTLNALGVPAVN